MLVVFTPILLIRLLIRLLILLIPLLMFTHVFTHPFPMVSLIKQTYYSTFTHNFYSSVHPPLHPPRGSPSSSLQPPAPVPAPVPVPSPSLLFSSSPFFKIKLCLSRLPKIAPKIRPPPRRKQVGGAGAVNENKIRARALREVQNILEYVAAFFGVNYRFLTP